MNQPRIRSKSINEWKELSSNRWEWKRREELELRLELDVAVATRGSVGTRQFLPDLQELKRGTLNGQRYGPKVFVYCASRMNW